jgi:NitT/TauT family transport system permease protein
VRQPDLRRIARATRAATWFPPFVALGALAGVWQIISAHAPLVLPSLSAVASELVDHPGLFLSNAGVTLEEALVGASCSFVVAMILATAMVHGRFLERAIMPVAVLTNVTPVVSIAPALVVAFGFGMAPRYIVTALITFFPFLVNGLVGMRSVEPGALEILRSLNASRTEILLRLRVPSSLPFLFAAARVCLPLSIVGAVVAEFVSAGTNRGLGSLIATSEAQSSLSPIYAAVWCLAILGIALSVIVVLAERRFLSWNATA